MSVAVDLSLSVMSATASRDVLQEPCLANSAHELSELWRSAFAPAAELSANDWRDLPAIQQVAPLPLMPDAWTSGAVSADAQHAPISTPQPQAVPSAPTESVSVYIHAASVAIVVRNMTLSEEKALQCAFATAGELLGERGALHDLILNGRAIYQQRHASDSRDRIHAGWRLTA